MYMEKVIITHNCSSSTDALNSIANFIVVEIAYFVCHTSETEQMHLIGI